LVTLHQLRCFLAAYEHGSLMEAAVIALPVADPTLEVHPIHRDELMYVSAHAGRLQSPVTSARLARAP
jgi:hypothetical protein